MEKYNENVSLKIDYLSAKNGVKKLLTNCIPTTMIVQYSGAIFVPVCRKIFVLLNRTPFMPENCWNVISPSAVISALLGALDLKEKTIYSAQLYQIFCFRKTKVQFIYKSASKQNKKTNKYDLIVWQCIIN